MEVTTLKSYRFPPDLAERLRRQALKENRSERSLVMEILDRALAEREAEAVAERPPAVRPGAGRPS